jgi:site-specific recombinase XerC
MSDTGGLASRQTTCCHALQHRGTRLRDDSVRVVDVVLEGGACVHLHGKSRKLRSIPLWKSTVVEIRAWLRLNPSLRGEAALIPNRDGQAMSRSNVAQRLALAVNRAAVVQPVSEKRASPHTPAYHADAPVATGVPSIASAWPS